jgi:hypothetical protein
VPPGECAVRGEIQHGIVDSPPVLLAFLDPDDEPDPVVAGDGAQPLRRRTRYHDSVLGEQPEPVFVAIPDRLGIDPDRRARDEDLGECHQLSALRSGRGRQLTDPLQGRRLVHEHVTGLHRGHSK